MAITPPSFLLAHSIFTYIGQPYRTLPYWPSCMRNQTIFRLGKKKSRKSPIHFHIYKFFKKKKITFLSWMMCLINCVLLTSPSLGLMFVSWITSRWADWETRGSEESEMMWSQTPERVLH